MQEQREISKAVLLRAKRKFIEDMEWFVGNHNDTYNDKKKGEVPGYYAGMIELTNVFLKELGHTWIINLSLAVKKCNGLLTSMQISLLIK